MAEEQLAQKIRIRGIQEIAGERARQTLKCTLQLEVKWHLRNNKKKKYSDESVYKKIYILTLKYLK